MVQTPCDWWAGVRCVTLRGAAVSSRCPTKPSCCSALKTGGQKVQTFPFDILIVLRWQKSNQDAQYTCWCLFFFMFSVLSPSICHALPFSPSLSSIPFFLAYILICLIHWQQTLPPPSRCSPSTFSSSLCKSLILPSSSFHCYFFSALSYSPISTLAVYKCIKLYAETGAISLRKCTNSSLVLFPFSTVRT